MKRSKILFIGMMTTAMIVSVVPAEESAQNAQYYTLVDVLDLAATRHEEYDREVLLENAA